MLAAEVTFDNSTDTEKMKSVAEGRDREYGAGNEKAKGGKESNGSPLESTATLKMAFAIGIN